MELKRVLEACLFAAGKPLSLTEMQALFDEEKPALAELEQALQEIGREYEERPLMLRQVASGYRFQVRTDVAPWVARLFEEKPGRFSKALLETLAVIAYRQPATRGDIESIRGVSVSSGIIRTLMDREWVRVVGRKEVPGRPALYATTKQFLDYFNLRTLDELPILPERLVDAAMPPDPSGLPDQTLIQQANVQLFETSQKAEASQ